MGEGNVAGRSGASPGRQLPDDVEAALTGLEARESRAESARLLALAANRAISMLHKLARDEAAREKGSPNWASWAKLVNASRNAVLAASVSREVAAALADRAARPPKSGPPGEDGGP